MKDAASFNRQDIIAVFGEFPSCLLCGRRAEDVNHSLKRGYNEGIRPDDEDREIMSSVFGASCLCRNCHSRGDIHRPEIQRTLLQKTKNMVELAVANRVYELKQKDRDFLQKFELRYTYRLSHDLALRGGISMSN